MSTHINYLHCSIGVDRLSPLHVLHLGLVHVLDLLYL